MLLLVVPLAGCLEEQETQLAKCKFQTMTAGLNIEEGVGAQRVQLCMAAAGYEMDVHPGSVSADTGPSNAFDRGLLRSRWSAFKVA